MVELSSPEFVVEAGNGAQGRHGGGVARADGTSTVEKINRRTRLLATLAVGLAVAVTYAEVEMRVRIILTGEVVESRWERSSDMTSVARHGPTRHNDAKARIRQSVKAVDRSRIDSKEKVRDCGAA